LLEHRLVQLRLRQQLLQPHVLAFELLEPLGVVRLETAVLGDPAVPGRLGDLKVPAHLVELAATRQELVALSQLADDLVGRMPTSGHGCCPPAPVWGNGLAHHLDHYEGGTSFWPGAWSPRCSSGRSRRAPPGRAAWSGAGL